MVPYMFTEGQAAFSRTVGGDVVRRVGRLYGLDLYLGYPVDLLVAQGLLYVHLDLTIDGCGSAVCTGPCSTRNFELAAQRFPVSNPYPKVFGGMLTSGHRLGVPKMVRASISLSLPNGIWIGALSREFADARFQVRSARSSSDVGVGFVEIISSDYAQVLREMETRDAVRTVEVFQRENRRALVQIEAEEPILLKLLDRTGVPIEMPFEIQAGEVQWTLTTTRTRLSSLAEVLEESDLRYIVEQVREDVTFDQVLTERQREVLKTALECGYYDSPRRCTQGELAAELDLAKSTCCETLHRAEERIIKEYDGEDRSVLKSSPSYA